MTSVSVKNLVVTRSSYPAIAQSSFELPGHHCAIVTGPNGSGKTTLLKSIAGSVYVERGEITLSCEDEVATSRNVRELRRMAAYVGHTPLYMRHINVEEHLSLCAALDVKHSRSAEYTLSLHDALDIFHLTSRAKVKVEDLSAGQQRRLHLASSFVRSTPLLCVDEPHASLDDASKEALDAAVKRQYNAGRSFIIATHDPSRFQEISTHHIRIENGCTQLETAAGESQ